MSLYIPERIVLREKWQQTLRALHGVKIGTHSKFPDLETGPFIIRNDKLEQMSAHDKTMLEIVANQNSVEKKETQAQKIGKKFKKLFGATK